MSKALVVDDSRAMRLILAGALGELCFDVMQAANGVEALEIVAREGQAMSLALVDWNMPEMTGIDFVRRLRAQRAYDHVPLIMVTTETEIEQVALALEAGANEYIMKPFTCDAIADKLRLLGVVQ